MKTIRKTIRVSACCGYQSSSTPGPHGTPDGDYEDLQLCPKCHDHTGYIDVCEDCGEEKCECER